jgi:cysteine sulfinate desulfinase/cysteine desulfurase-like protein
MKPDSGASRQMVRFSVGPANTVTEIESTVTVVRRSIAALKS